MTEDLKTLAENAFTACYEKGLGDKSEDREAWTLREAVCKLAKAELFKALDDVAKENVQLRRELREAEARIPDRYDNYD